MTQDEALSYAVDTKSFRSGDIRLYASELIGEHFPGKRVLPVADLNTWRAAGEKLREALDTAGIGMDEPFLFETTDAFEADVALVPSVLKSFDPETQALVAIGSGTMNDIVKVAAFEAGVRYMVVATAASVDGYTSPGASMIIDGFKQSLYCHAPIAVLADSDILKSAPTRMLSAGYADLASKITAGADWIIADELGIDPIDPVCWEMIQIELLDWLRDPAGVVGGDPDTFDRVMYGLTMTGIGMQYLRASRPASGAEHLLSHIWEMEEHRHEGRVVSHGFQVALGTLGITAFMEVLFSLRPDSRILEHRIDTWPSWEEREAEVTGVLGGFGGIERIIDENRGKYVDRSALSGRHVLILDRWDRMAARALERLIPYRELRDSFAKAGCPVSSDDISLTKERLIDTFRKAGMLRNRYTVLDLAWECGMFERVCEILADSADYPL